MNKKITARDLKVGDYIGYKSMYHLDDRKYRDPLLIITIDNIHELIYFRDRESTYRDTITFDAFDNLKEVTITRYNAE